MRLSDVVRETRWVRSAADEMVLTDLPGLRVVAEWPGPWSVVSEGSGILSGSPALSEDPTEELPDGVAAIYDEFLAALGLSDAYIAVLTAGGHSVVESMYLSLWDRKTGVRLGQFSWPQPAPGTSLDQLGEVWYGADAPTKLRGHEELVAKLVSLGL